MEVIYSAAYLFLDKNYIFIDGDPENEIIVEIKPKEKNTSLKEIAMQFNNELLNYVNYAINAEKNARIREALFRKIISGVPAEYLKNNPEKNEKFYLEKEAKPWKTK